MDQSELAFRLLCRRHGATAAYTPMLHSRLFLESQEYQEEHFTTCAEDRQAPRHSRRCPSLLKRSSPAGVCRPLLAQFCANDPDTLVAAARLVQDRCDAVDLNLGCPQRIAKRGRYGAFLMDDLPLVGSLVSALASSLSVPVTAKVQGLLHRACCRPQATTRSPRAFSPLLLWVPCWCRTAAAGRLTAR